MVLAAQWFSVLHMTFAFALVAMKNGSGRRRGLHPGQALFTWRVSLTVSHVVFQAEGEDFLSPDSCDAAWPLSTPGLFGLVTEVYFPQARSVLFCCAYEAFQAWLVWIRFIVSRLIYLQYSLRPVPEIEDLFPNWQPPPKPLVTLFCKAPA